MASAALTDNLERYYKHDNNTNIGTISIDNASLVNGTMSGVTANVTGHILDAFEFGGGNDKVTMGNLDIQAAEYTYAFWFNSTSSDAWVAMLSYHDGGSTSTGVWYGWGTAGKLACTFEESGSADLVTFEDNYDDGAFHFVVCGRNSSNVFMFIDNVLVNTTTNNNRDVGAAASMTLGVRSDNDGNDFVGRIDEVGIWNRSLTTAEINNLWNNGDGFSFPFPAVSADLQFANETGSFKTTFDEGENFNAFINWTLTNGSAVDNSTGRNCTITFFDGLLEDVASTADFSICQSGCDFQNVTDEFEFHSNDTFVQDQARMNVCHNNLASRDISVNFSCGAIEDIQTISASDFPICSLGFGEVFINSTVCNFSNNVNVTLTNTAPGTNQAHNISEWELDRQFSIHDNFYDADVFYNDTLDMWQTSHTHEYYVHQSARIDGNCSDSNDAANDANVSETVTIVNLPPDVNINQIIFPDGSAVNLVDGVEIEYQNGSWQFVISAVDDDLETVNITLFANLTVRIFDIANGTTVFNLSSTLFRDLGDNLFNISVFTNDTAGASTNATLTFLVNDTVDPSCNFAAVYFVPFDDNFTFNVTCTDESFFSLNVSCIANSYENFTDGLNLEEFIFAGINEFNVSETCTFRYCDGHTGDLKGNWFSLKDENGSNIYKDNVKIASLSAEDGEVEFEKEDDRLKFKVKWDNKKPYQTLYYQTTKNSYYFESAKYPGWIVDSATETWFDLKSVLKPTIFPIKHANGLWEFKIYSDAEEIEFESIGELNCVSGSFEIREEFQFTLTAGACPTTTAGVLTLWLVVAFALFFMGVGWLFDIREAGFIGSLLLIPASWTVVACHNMTGWIMVLAGIFFMFWFLLKKPSSTAYVG